MAWIWSMLALALAVSLDGFAAGMMYGIRNIRIPGSSVIIVSVCSALVLFMSMALGEILGGWLPEPAARRIGAGILIAVGVWAIVQMALTPQREAAAARFAAKAAPVVRKEPRALQFEIRPLGLIIRIWRTPSMADMDRSGTISAAEAVLLGLALSLDSLGAGIGAALIGFPPAVTALAIGAACGGCIAAGAKIGRLLSGMRWLNKLTLLPGCILIIMGCMKFL